MRLIVDFLPDFELPEELMVLRVVSYKKKLRFKQNYVDRVI